MSKMSNSDSKKQSPLFVTLMTAGVLGLLTAVGVWMFLRGNETRDGQSSTSPIVVQSGQESSEPEETTSTQRDSKEQPSVDEPVPSESIAKPGLTDDVQNSPEVVASSQVVNPSAVSEEENSDGKTSDESEQENPPELPDSVKSLRLGPTVDLIERYAPENHTTEGTWKNVGGSLVSDKGSVNTFLLPYELPEKYVMRIRARRLNGNDTLFVRTRMLDRQADIAFNAWYGTLGGIEKLDNMLISDKKNESRFKKPMVGTDKPSDIVITSRVNSISVSIDGQSVIDWKGNPSQISLHYDEPKETFGLAKLTAVRSSWKISHFSVTPILDEPRVAAPEEDQVEKMMRELEDRHNLNFRVSRRDDKQELVRKLQAFLVEESDPVARYTLLTNALENATAIGDLEVSLSLANEIVRGYELDSGELKREVIEGVSKARRDPASGYQLSLLCSESAWKAADDHDYEEAMKYSDLAVDLSRKLRLRSLTAQLQSLHQLFESWNQKYSEISQSADAIRDGTATEENHLAWGKFLCFVRTDWNTGLPHLQQGANEALSQLAEAELTLMPSFDSVTNLVKRWLEVASQFDEDVRSAIETHARALSTKAIPFAEANERPLIDQYARRLFGDAEILNTNSQQDGILLGGANVNPPGEMTIEFWFRTTDLKGGLILRREKERHDCIGAMVENGKAVLFANGSFYLEKRPTQARVSDGQWHHIAISKVDTHLRLFVDGIPQGDLQLKAGFPKPNDSSWRLGDQKWIDGYDLAGQFTRIRLSSPCRYHVRFVPERQYDPDRQTLLYR